jgi:hypothetical protein
MKAIFGIILTLSISFISLSQNKTTKMDWLLRDRKIELSDAKKEGFAISFRGPRTFDSPYKVNFKQLSNVWAEGVEGDLEVKLFYFIDFDRGTVSIYDYYRKLYKYEIKRKIVRGDNIKIKMKYRDEKSVIVINLVSGDFKQITYNKKTKIYTASSHESIYLYPKDENR